MDRRDPNGQNSALLWSEQQPAAQAIYKLERRAKAWALMRGASIDAAFSTWEKLKRELLQVFAPPNKTYRTQFRFLAGRQGKQRLGDYVQMLRALIAFLR